MIDTWWQLVLVILVGALALRLVIDGIRRPSIDQIVDAMAKAEEQQATMPTAPTRPTPTRTVL